MQMETTSFLNYWVLQVFAMLLTILLIPRLRMSGLSGALLMVGGLAAVNFYLWDAHLFFALPDSFSARAALLVVTNGLIFWALAKIMPGIEIDGVMPAIAAPVVFTGCSILIHNYGGTVDWAEVFKISGGWLVQTMSELREYFQS